MFRHARGCRASLSLLAPVTLAAAIQLSPSVHAALGDEAQFLADLPVVLSATRLKQSRHESPTAVTVIDRHMIAASGARTITDLMRLVPGMTAGFANGNHQVISYHGMSDEFSRRMQVLVDGRSIYLPSFGGIPWTSLPLALEDIDRIEIIRGPNSASYGSNSFLGVISIITRPALESQGIYSKVTRGDHDIADAVLRYGQRSDQLDYRITLNYRQDAGFNGVTHYGGREYDNNDWSRVRGITGRAYYQAGAMDRWEFHAGLSESPQGNGTFYNDPADPPRSFTEQANFLQLRWERQLGNGDDIHLQFHRDELDTADYYRVPVGIPLSSSQVNALFGVALPATLVDASVDTSLRTQRYDLEFQHRYSPLQGTRFVWGSSLRTDRARAPGWFGTEDWIYNHWFRLFGNVEHRLSDRLMINAGAMLERNTIIGNDISPRIGLNYRINDYHSVRAACSKASRTPAMIEEFSNVNALLRVDLDTGMGINTLLLPEQLLYSSYDLGRERINSSELGYFGEFFQRQVKLDMKLFYDELDSLITQTTHQNKPIAIADNDVIDFEHTDAARIKGVETQIDWRPSTHTSVRFGHAYIEIDSDDNWENYSTSAPRNSYMLFASHRFPRQLDTSLAYHYSDEMEWLEWESIDSISRLDVRIAKGFRLDGYDAQLALVAQNVLGDHIEFRRGNHFDQRTFVQLSLTPR